MKKVTLGSCLESEEAASALVAAWAAKPRLCKKIQYSDFLLPLVQVNQA